ncbi:MAG: beta-glucosidase [Puniceicoccaceae bacterium 5H]|nr:MAG: beta-glucosidase [Puniceicoccaceae bacterium 5H]
MAQPDACYTFPESFLWGSATSSYQIEGGHDADGRGPSVWDAFCRQPGRIHNGDSGDRACDHYHRYREDIDLMTHLGLQAYRFSIAWPRVMPDGRHANEAGWDFYDRLVDTLLERGIEPWVTVFHWDWPQALEDLYGGWRSPRIIEDFAHYAGEVSRRLSDRVTRFFTINEFINFTDRAYHVGEFAPGLQLSRRERNQIRHHALLAHGDAVAAIRQQARRPDVQVGIAQDTQVCVPVMETEPHIAAARQAMRRLDAHFLTAILEGGYMPEYLAAEGEHAPAFDPADFDRISRPLDFVGINTYTPHYVRAIEQAPGFEFIPHPPGYPRMDVPWLYVGPQILYWVARHLHDLWQVKSVYVTENGCACDDRMNQQGEVLDTDRVMYLRNHLIAAHRAVTEGYPLHGYFAWSLLDNFEWADGYSKRFGLVHVNYETQKRTPKLSADYYRQVIAARSVL